MVREAKSRSLRKIVEVRTVQRLAAEAEATRASDAVRRLNEQVRQEGEQLTAHRLGWSQAVGASSLSLPLVAAWGAEITRDSDRLAQTQADLKASESVREARAHDWRVATANFEVARDLNQVARRQEGRQREEAQLNDLADRFAWRGQAR